METETLRREAAYKEFTGSEIPSRDWTAFKAGWEAGAVWEKESEQQSRRKADRELQKILRG